MSAPSPDSVYDAIVVGGGPAGLAAAFWLARYRRRVRVFDAEQARNEPSWAVHGYPGLPDLAPRDLRERLREQAVTAGAEYTQDRVDTIEGGKNGFRIALRSGAEVGARRVLLAYGRRDHLPDVPGLADVYGTVAFHCPDCDGPSMVSCQVGVIGWEQEAASLALYLLSWASAVVLLTNGRPLSIAEDARAVLERYQVGVRGERIRSIRPEEQASARVELEGAADLHLGGLFFHPGSAPASDLGERLGCRMNERGELEVDRGQETSVSGVYAAGDIASGLSHLAVHAAAEGVRAALTMHRSLLPPDCEF